ncbi:hypothetical protein [Roseateles sp. P5_D6]
MSTRLTLLIALTGASALVAAAVLDVPPEFVAYPSLAQRSAPQHQDPRDCDEWAAEIAAPAPPGDPQVHARALGACLAGPGYSVK